MTTGPSPSLASTIKLEPTWKAVLLDMFATPNMQALKQFSKAGKEAGKFIYLRGSLMFNAMNITLFDQRKTASHRGRGWEQFTDVIISALNQQRNHLVFLLWGSYVQQKGKFIDLEQHLVLASPHPLPLSAYHGFFGTRHFSRANAYLQQNGVGPIPWVL